MIKKREKWLVDRRKGIGGSDIAAILGYSPWKTPVDIWMDKTGRSPLESKVTERMDWGNRLEQTIADAYKDQTGWMVWNINRPIVDGIFRGNIDRVVTPSKRLPIAINGHYYWEHVTRILEIKTCDAYQRDEWGEAGTDEIPRHYAMQVQHYMMLTGISICDVAVLFGGNELVIYTVYVNDKWQSYVRNELLKWWESYVDTDTPPPTTTYGDVQQLFPDVATGTFIHAEKDDEVLVHHYQELLKVKKQTEVELEKTKGEICERIGGHEGLTNGCHSLVTWKSTKDHSKVNWQEIAQRLMLDLSDSQCQELLTTHTITRPGSRRFYITKHGKEL